MQRLPADLSCSELRVFHKEGSLINFCLIKKQQQGEEGEKKKVIVAASTVSDKTFQLNLNPYDDVTHFNIPLINPSVNSKPKFAAADLRMHPSNIQADCI